MKKINKMIETIELLNKDCICLFKIGNFYQVYGRDSYIIAFLLNYKIDIQNSEVGFPINSLNKVLAKIENEKINYITLDSRNNYDVDLKQDFKKLNRYDKVYTKAREYVNIRIRIDKIYDNLINSIDKKEIRKIVGSVEKLINEGREIQSNTAN